MTETDMQVSPTWTTNGLSDIVRLFKLGYCIVLCTSKGEEMLVHHIYHKCGEEVKNLSNIKIVHFDLSNHIQLLGEGEWPSFIEEAGCNECTCNVRKYSLNPLEITQLWSVVLKA
jgi:hypothetical protein